MGGHVSHFQSSFRQHWYCSWFFPTLNTHPRWRSLDSLHPIAKFFFYKEPEARVFIRCQTRMARENVFGMGLKCFKYKK
jgi:hypothetical protein